MSLLRRMMRAAGKKNRKVAPESSVTEAAAPLVPAVAGRPEGFLCNPHEVIIARSVEWEVVVHPALKEYTLRVKGEPEDHVVFDFDVVAEITQEHGVLWDPRKDKPPLGGAMMCKGKGSDSRQWYITLDRFINVVLDRVDALSKDTAQPIETVEDHSAERAVLDDEKAEAENKPT